MHACLICEYNALDVLSQHIASSCIPTPLCVWDLLGRLHIPSSRSITVLCMLGSTGLPIGRSTVSHTASATSLRSRGSDIGLQRS